MTDLPGGASDDLARTPPPPLGSIPAGRVTDMTRPFTDGFPVAAAKARPPRRHRRLSHVPDGFFAQNWSLDEHTGTHVDAPLHRRPGGDDVTALLPEELVLALRIVDVAAAAARDPDSLLGVDDVIAHERRHGPVPPGAAVVLHSGWDARGPKRADYLNTDAAGVPHNPGFSPAAARLLLDRHVACLATDTPSLDVGSSGQYPVHDLWLGAGRFAVEGLVRTGEVPPAGAHLVIGVLPWQGGSGGPCRALCLW